MSRRGVAILAEMGAIAAVAFTLAFWGWRLAAPRPAPLAPPVVPEQRAEAIGAAALFGRGTAAPVEAPSAGIPPMRLHGIVVEGRRRSRALISVSGQPEWFEAGGEPAPGLRVERIARDSVQLRDRTRTIELFLYEPRQAGAGTQGATPPPGVSTAPRTQTGTSSPRPGCPVDAATLRGAYFLRGELLESVARQPEQWVSLFRPDSGALLVEGEDAAVTLLGLKAGDRLERANGAALAVVEDMRRLVLEPLVANQVVRVTGTRQGAAARWVYVNATTCPPG